MKIGDAFNHLKTGALNTTNWAAKASATLLVGEVACRIAKTVLNKAQWINNNSLVNYLSQKTPALAGRVLRPYQGFSKTDLIIATAVCGIVKIACSEIAKKKGAPSPFMKNLRTFISYLPIPKSDGSLQKPQT